MLNYRTLCDTHTHQKKKKKANAKLNGPIVNFMVTYKEEVNLYYWNK